MTTDERQMLENEGMLMKLSKVELRHLRDILSIYASEARLSLKGWVSLNALLVNVGAEPRTEFGDDSEYMEVEKRTLPFLDSPDPRSGYYLKSGQKYIAAHGWTGRRDCADVFSLEQAEERRDFERQYGHHRDRIDIIPVEG
jgi:hypothetical protein